MDPFTAMALAQTGMKAVENVGSGAARVVNARQYYTKDDEERRRLLEQMKASGKLGLSQAEEAAIEQQYAVQRGGASREALSQGLQQAAVLGGNTNMQGRDLFLQQLAREEGDSRLRSAQASSTAQANLAAAQQQNKELQDLVDGEQKMKAERRAGVIQALTGGAQAGLGAAMPKLEQRVQAKQMTQQEEYAKRMLEYGYSPEETTRLNYAYGWK
jgi:hypothetical protein